MDTEIDAETETFETMVAGLVNHIFGEGEQGILEKLKAGRDDLPAAIGSMTYTLVAEGARQGTESGIEFDMELMVGVAAEVIDSLMQMCEAAGLIEDADDDALREDAMMAAVSDYSQSTEITPDQQADAQQMLQQMTDDGSVDEARSTIAAMGERKGIDPFADDDLDEEQQAPQPAAQAGPRPLIGGA